RGEHCAVTDLNPENFPSPDVAPLRTTGNENLVGSRLPDRRANPLNGAIAQGTDMAHSYRFGMEEEYFLVDAESKTVAREMPEDFRKEVEEATGGRVKGEFLQSQIEAATVPHTDMGEAGAELRFLRQTVAAVAARHGLAIIAAGTHPTAFWKRSQQTP